MSDFGFGAMKPVLVDVGVIRFRLVARRVDLRSYFPLGLVELAHQLDQELSELFVRKIP